MTLPAFAAEQQASRTPSPLLLSIEGTDRRTDGRTPDGYVETLLRILCQQRQKAIITDRVKRSEVFVRPSVPLWPN